MLSCSDRSNQRNAARPTQSSYPNHRMSQPAGQCAWHQAQTSLGDKACPGGRRGGQECKRAADQDNRGSLHDVGTIDHSATAVCRRGSPMWATRLDRIGVDGLCPSEPERGRYREAERSEGVAGRVPSAKLTLPGFRSTRRQRRAMPDVARAREGSEPAQGSDLNA